MIVTLKTVFLLKITLLLKISSLTGRRRRRRRQAEKKPRLLKIRNP